MAEVVGFRARLAMVRTEDGGHRKPIRIGYRVQSRFTDDQPWDNDVVILIEGAESCAPGNECIVQAEFMVPDAVTVAVEAGSTFVLREGPHVTARGTVLAPLHEPFWNNWLRDRSDYQGRSC